MTSGPLRFTRLSSEPVTPTKRPLVKQWLTPQRAEPAAQVLFAADDTGVKTLSVACPYIRYALWNNENTVNAFILNDPSTMADIYASSLQAKYESVLQTVSSGLGLGDDLTALTKSCAELVHNAAEQAIFDWAARREIAGQPPRPISNLQHLLDEYCAIADHL